MSVKLIFSLKRAAKRAGGDRYEASIKKDEVMVVYIPQSISREGSKPFEELEITIQAL